MGPQDCFFDCETDPSHWQDGFDLCVRSTATSSFTRFLAMAHVECPLEEIRIDLRAKELTAGTMKILWDGHEVDSMTAPGFLRGEVSVSKSGGHTLSLEVTHEAHVSTVARVQFWGILMMSTFTRCMDTQQCLRELDESGTAGQSLRSSNQLLSQCLRVKFKNAGKLRVVGPACESWRRCLRKSGQSTEEHMRLLLSAAALTQGAGSSMEAKDDVACINPPTEDPMGWECDCFKEMAERCKALGASKSGKLRSCLQAQYCLHDKICVTWREAVCKTKNMQRWKEKLKKLEAQERLSQLTASSNHNQGSRITEEFVGGGPMHFMYRSAVRTNMTGNFDATGAAKRCK
eukprot:gnl/TRDRNA2_/TRDRNA2_176590_c2_seq15.p1 gnl/TRDRNA2_/TRDRNA2_176590_c2~~gnl/TRDRNA2_/TRDRNA2_176590_c2_seq15.p1  ORF type:complete len:346 (-),score=54.56 gnl/TRDRNA2_/TRDRNA2_176590_c2_seq15:390-1427(-)